MTDTIHADALWSGCSTSLTRSNGGDGTLRRTILDTARAAGSFDRLGDIEADGLDGWYIHFSCEPATIELLRALAGGDRTDPLWLHARSVGRYIVRTRIRDINIA